ncbi:BKACE family enzyme [Haloplanus aerogenes]|uniref:3-keto-5-aminohexanoate cleavage enzyme n=1 Tax=Haloplanus aerogenes TaxID=660522 RepID=A0A3M0DXE8_9EURY|nr:3-keto-5-aminohexanoate cleavage protein [Haloplanus aerogenes]AZH25760.1 3-keto-5-aminohexanoate cleavage protein [Haloplanus aerogenes]RMB25497.1 3-keto-5-aminohexanoate cleavage enzyme [Haloplanus aerogenes]
MTYADYRDGKPVILTAALTGGVHGKEANPNLPETPAEIGEAAAAAERAGASIVHLHARRDNGERAFATERFQEVTDAVRARTDDVIVQHSTGGTGAPNDLRAEPLRTDPAPEMASLDMGPLNRYQHLTSENTRGLVAALHAEMQERGIKPELEVFNGGHLNESLAILDSEGSRSLGQPARSAGDELDDPPYLNLVFGGGTTTIPHPRNLLNLVENLPAGVEFNVLAFGPHQLPLTTMGILLGGHVRVGLEDNLYYRKGELAESNAQLVERTAGIAEQLGRPVATPAEAREILGL